MSRLTFLSRHVCRILSSLGVTRHGPPSLSALRTSTTVLSRAMSARARKRFYKDVSVVHNGSSGEFELCLDHRKLKTPLGRDFRLTNEALARAVAQEWTAQKELVLLSQMHLTGLCNVCIDNPMGATREDLVEGALAFLDTDTVLFFSDNNSILLARQQAEWQPIIDWFCTFHGGIDIRPSPNMSRPEISSKAREAIRRHLLSYDFKSLNGFSFGVDSSKSIILATAAVERRLSVEEAVRLSRLEVVTQTDQWGVVEWCHDLELHDTTARFAAATMFVQLNSIQHLTKEKSFQA